MATAQEQPDQALARISEGLRAFLRDGVDVRLTSRGSRAVVELSGTAKGPDGREESRVLVIDPGKAEKPREGERTRGPAAPDGKVRQAVIKLTEITPTGYKGKVVKTFLDLDRAKFFGDKHGLALYPGGFVERLARGDTVEISKQTLEALELKGKGKDLAYQARVLHWQAEQGRYHNAGIWYDKEETPRIGQYVHYSSGRDFRGEPEDRRVVPLRPIEPGRLAEPRHVVFEMSRRTPGFARIVSLPASGAEARADVRMHDQERLSRQTAALREQWKTLDTSPGLRAMADAESRKPRPDSPEPKPTTPRDPASEPMKTTPSEPATPLTVTTHVKGHARADVVTRTGEDGKQEHVVLLTREVRQADGRTRAASVVLDISEAREIYRLYDQVLRQGADVSAQGRPKQEGQARTSLHEALREVREREQRRQNQVGSWMGESPPKMNQEVRWESGVAFDPGKGTLARGIGRVYPVDGPIRSGPQQDPLYVGCEREGGTGSYRVFRTAKDPWTVRGEAERREKARIEEARAGRMEHYGSLLALVEKDQPQNERLKNFLKSTMARLGPDPRTQHQEVNMESDRQKDERLKRMLFEGAPLPDGRDLPSRVTPPPKSNPEDLRRAREEAASLTSASYCSWAAQPFPQPSDAKLGMTTLMAKPACSGGWQDLSEGGKAYTLQHWVNWDGVSKRDRAALVLEQVDVDRMTPKLRDRLVREASRQEGHSQQAGQGRDRAEPGPTQGESPAHTHKPRR